MQNTYTTSHNNINTYTAAPVEGIAQLRQEGLLTIVLPGRELDFAKQNTPQLLQLLKQVGRTDLSVGRIYEGHINALLLIHRFANEEQKERWHRDAENGCLFGVWNTQAADGIEFTTGEESFGLRGKKTFASGAGIVKRALISGNRNWSGGKTWQMCIVDTEQLPHDAIDYNSWQPMGMTASVSYTVDFGGYEGSIHDLLGKKDDYYKQPWFGAGAIRFCAVQLGGAEALFNETISYLKSLDRTDDSYQAMRIADMATAITSGQLWIEQSAYYWDKWIGGETNSRRLIAFANMTRIAIETICLRVIELASKCVGARGLMQPYRMESLVRDLGFYLRQPAPDAALRDAANYVIHSDQPVENIWNDDENHH